MHYEIWIHKNGENGWFPICARNKNELKTWIDTLNNDETVTIGEIDKITNKGRELYSY